MTIITIERLKTQGTYEGFCDTNKGYLYSYNNNTFIWNGQGLTQI